MLKKIQSKYDRGKSSFLDSGGSFIKELFVLVVLSLILAILIMSRFSIPGITADDKICRANIRRIAAAMATYEIKENKQIVWEEYSTSDLVKWGYLLKEPICPAEKNKPFPLKYSLISGNPDEVVCPNQRQLSGHVWP
ncbi:MAG: hypothetical protein ABII88_01740 [Candidatus Omnitrophota bacterium]